MTPTVALVSVPSPNTFTSRIINPSSKTMSLRLWYEILKRLGPPGCGWTALCHTVSLLLPTSLVARSQSRVHSPVRVRARDDCSSQQLPVKLDACLDP